MIQSRLSMVHSTLSSLWSLCDRPRLRPLTSDKLAKISELDPDPKE
ncbi:MAG TPA: hypothetical protein V6C93_08160 [Allocoleopsis sp.]